MFMFSANQKNADHNTEQPTVGITGKTLTVLQRCGSIAPFFYREMAHYQSRKETTSCRRHFSINDIETKSKTGKKKNDQWDLKE